jgi:hypothetical protein
MPRAAIEAPGPKGAFFMPATGKTCSACRETMPLTSFLPSRLHSDGVSDRCRQCVLDAARRDRHEREARAANRRTHFRHRPT